MSTIRPVEVELKYRLDDVMSGERLLTAEAIGPFRSRARTRTTQHEDRYLDTADGALARSGFAARLRTAAKDTVVTVKALARGGDGALSRREELEGPAERASQPRDWPNSAARSLILELCGDAPLVETVTVRQLRRRRELNGAGAVVELSLDEVDVVVRSRIVDRFVELEIELLSGGEEALDELARALATEPGLSPEPGSKLESALRAARDAGGKAGGDASAARAAAIRTLTESPAPTGTGAHDGRRRQGGAGRGRKRIVARERAARNSAETTHATSEAPPRAAPGKPDTRAEAPPPAERQPDEADAAAETNEADAANEAAPIRLSVGKTPGVLGEDTLAEAGRKVMRFHFARMLAKEPGTRSGADPEDLHGMRVATRRLRAAWRVFGDAYRKGRTKSYRQTLRDTASRLGAVRDLDVLLEAADAYRKDESHVEKRGLEPLLAEWRTHRDDARVLLVRELDSADYQRFVEDFREFVRTDGAGARPIQPMIPHRVRDTAASRIQSAFEQVRAYEAVLRWADVETLHELRIAGKWLRYTMEFVREPLGPEAGLLIAKVVALQDHLGSLHDADVAASLARGFLVQRSGQLSQTETAAIGRYLVNREREVARLRRSVGPVWRGVAGLVFRRRLGRALATL